MFFLSIAHPSEWDSESDSESEYDNEVNEKSEQEQIAEEELASDILPGAKITTFKGVRVSESIDPSKDNCFFKVRRENDSQQLFLHKQTACWLLSEDKTSLSSDRLSRVMQSK